MSFKSFVSQQELFERSFSEIKQLGEPDQQTFLEVLKRSIAKSPRNALQIYILALIIGIPKEKLLSVPSFNQSPEIAKTIQAALTSQAGLGFMKDFADEVKKINGIDDKTQMPDMNNPDVLKLIQNLSNKYGQVFDIENIKDKIKEPASV